MFTGLEELFVLVHVSSFVFIHSDLKASETDKTCTLPEVSGSAPLEIDPKKENEVLFTYSVHWMVSSCCIDPQQH